jgi:hypothetical protein
VSEKYWSEDALPKFSSRGLAILERRPGWRR